MDVYAKLASSFNKSNILKEIRFVFMSNADEIAMSRRIQTRIEI